MGQQARWLTFIELFDFEIQHRCGARHGNADGLSRRPVEEDNEESRLCRTQAKTIQDTGETSLKTTKQ